MSNCYNELVKPISTSIFSFREFITRNLFYVDKTRFVYNLVNRADNFFFIARPRRYGKSLFCSMLHSLFEGDKELFNGLYIAENTDYDFRSYPVLHFDFSGMDVSSNEVFLYRFRSLIREESRRNGISLKDSNPAEMLENLILTLAEKKGKIAIIVDEYDSPLTSVLRNNDTAEEIRASLNPFYATMKKHSDKIRFLFITGVTRFSNLSIFSAMNNIIDISMEPESADAFGYTEEELSEYFRDGIDEYLSRHKEETKDAFIGRIRNYYDGYRFSPWSEKTVYNPVSIGMFFNSGCRFENYWDKTGVSTMAVNLALQKDLTGLLSADCYVSLSSFYAFDVSSIQSNLKQDEALVLLYYAGYLTIKNYTDSILFLDFQNLEVAGSFTKNLVSRYMETGLSQVDFWIMQFRNAAREGNEEAVKEKLVDYFDAFSYEMTNQKENERFYHGIFHAIFVMAGTYAVSEDRGPRGRADEVIITDEHIWIFELKIDKSADEALRQIENKGYAEKYAYLMKPGMTIHKIGISFSSKTKRIAEWKTANS